MPKNLLIFTLVLTISFNLIQSFAITSRMYDFNNTSDLNNYFNNDGDPHGSNVDYGGLLFTGSVLTSGGYENIWTSKKGFITSGTGDVFQISGYYFNNDIFGYGSFGFSPYDVNSGDIEERASPPVGFGVVFHGGGGYFVNNGVYTEVLWPPDLDDMSWYKFDLLAENLGGNKFSLFLLIYKADNMGNLLLMKSNQYLEITNPTMGSAPKTYAYFGSSVSRFTQIDNIKVSLTGATFEEDGKPTVTTTDISSISKTAGVSGGEVTSESGSSVTEKGVCYGTSANPTISGTCTSDGTGLGTFPSTLSGLSAGTKYYYRAFATNLNGTSYGTEKNFTTISETTSPTVTVKKTVFSKDTKCRSVKPNKTTWIKLKETIKNGVKGTELTWSQMNADKVTIKILNEKKKIIYSLAKTKNDGRQFLPFIKSSYEVKLTPHNGCQTGDTVSSFSKDILIL